MKRTRIFIMTLLMIFCGTILMAQQATPPPPGSTCLPCSLSLTGYIRDKLSGAPIEGASVYLYADAGSSQDITNEEGYYRVAAASCGACRVGGIEILAEGYQSISERVITNESGTADFELIPLNSLNTVYFDPPVLEKKLVNLMFFEEGIPRMPSIFTGAIVGDFSMKNHLYVDSGDQKLAAYGITVKFDNSVVIINTEKGNHGVENGELEVLAAVNADTPGEIRVSSFDVSGVGPSSNIHVCTFNWLAQTYEGSTDLEITVNNLVDDFSNPIPVKNLGNGKINISYETCVVGDVNGDGVVNIIDALLIAQYYVGIPQPGLDIQCGDVDHDGALSIIDALLIAQYYVGLITTF